MKKVLSLLCILMLCLPAVAQKKTASKSSAKKSTTTATYSGGSSRSSSTSIKQKGKFGITADINVNTGNTLTIGPDGTGGTVTTDTPNRVTSWGFNLGAVYFVTEKLELGLGLGYNNQRTFLGLDTDGATKLYQNIGFFNITPAIGYHIPLCNWLHYVPKLELGFGFGSVVTDLTFIPQTTRQTGSSFQFYADLSLLNFEVLAHKHFSLTLDVGGLTFVTQTLKPAPNTSRTTNSFNMNLLNGALVGFRYYF